MKIARSWYIRLVHLYGGNTFDFKALISLELFDETLEE